MPVITNSSSKLYFPNLNGLRFIAAMIVLVSHVEQFKEILKQPSLNPLFLPAAHLAVLLFFTLSGFLITYLLLMEKDQFKNISVKLFYARRAFRIWPLYFFLVITGLFIIPRIPFFNLPDFSEQVSHAFYRKTVLYLLFLPNVAFVVYPLFPYISHLWTIGVEEQFYIIWPWLMKWVKKPLAGLLTFLFVSIFFINGGGTFIVGSIIHLVHVFDPSTEKTIIHYIDVIFGYFRIDCMAIGALGAYLLYFQKQKMIDILFHRFTQLMVYAALIIIFVFQSYLHVNDILFVILIDVLILNLAANPARLFSLGHPVFHFLGKISYGLYMFHPLAIIVAIKFFVITGKSVSGFVPNLIVYVSAMLLSVIFATTSYYLLERPFLKFKSAYTRVPNLQP